MIEQTFTVVGMTCDHCVRTVSAELSKLAGVQRVSVDLASGRVGVESADLLAPADVAAAIDEAGYEVAS